MHERKPKDYFSLLRSIKHDSEFVMYCATMFNLPVVPNERAGTWYVAPELRVNEGLKKEHAQSVYFKSTDGHNGKWDFSLKRMNLHILEMTFASGGLVSVDHRIMIVDATRRGKRFPDSLSKTIPIWCSVINNVVYQYQRNENPNIEIEWDLEFHSIPTAVSNSEKEQIKKLIPSFVEKLLNTKTNFKKMQSLVKKPLRPLWIHPSSLILSDGPVWTEKELIDLPFIPIVCVSASISFSQDLNMFQTTPVFPLPNTFNYVQGAADDSETWAPGFTSTHFWLINDQINDAISVQDLEDLIKEKLKTKVNFESPNYGSNHFEWIGKTKIAIGSRHAGNPIRCFENFDFVINCGSEQFEGMGKNYLYLDIPEGKKGQRQFFQNIDIALNAVKNILGKKILIHCMQGIDRSVGIAIAILLKYMDADESLSQTHQTNIHTKMDVMNILLFIKEHRPQANPTRATMKQLNLYFLRQS